MKELTIEEKAKCYDKALENAKHYHSEMGDDICCVLEECFPQLKESDDDVIKKELIFNFKNLKRKAQIDRVSEKWYGLSYDDIIAWLEKQESKEINVKALLTADKLAAAEMTGRLKERKDIVGNPQKYGLEKQGEQKPVEWSFNEGEQIQINPSEYINDMGGNGCYLKNAAQEPADKVEPKFKVGDYVVGKYISGYISEIRDNCYFLDYQGFPIDKQDNYHLWSIKDAKDGDVLTWDDTTCVVLFKNIKNSKCFISYCFANDINFEIGTSHYIEGCHPATKEQRDLLFQKMKEAGYEWDADKKELKRIENEIEIPFGAKDSELQEATYYIPKGFYAKIEDDKVVIKKGEKPTAWSEEDEKMLDIILNDINYAQKNFSYSKLIPYGRKVDWLKSLRSHTRWKPSEEQLKSLQEVIDVGHFTSYPNALETLYEQLKQL